jgi:hypothetical protein
MTKMPFEKDANYTYGIMKELENLNAHIAEFMIVLKKKNGENCAKCIRKSYDDDDDE